MSDLLGALSFAASGMEAQSMRLRHVSENIANADTPGYRRKTMSFEASVSDGRVVAGPVKLDRSDLVTMYDPGHPLADATGHYDGSNVDLVIEIADAREAQRALQIKFVFNDKNSHGRNQVC